MRARLVLVLAPLAALVAAPVTAAAQPPDCALSYPPKGEIDVEYTRLLRAEGPLKCPMALEEPVLDREGAFQEFQRGQIGWSPPSGNSHAVQATYFSSPTVRRTGTASSSAGGTCRGERRLAGPPRRHGPRGDRPGRGEGGRSRDRRPDHFAAFSPDPRGQGIRRHSAASFLSTDETMSRTAGAIGVRVNRYQAGR